MRGLLVLDEVGGPHLVLADARREDRALGGELADALDDLLRGERCRRRAGRSRAGRSRASG